VGWPLVNGGPFHTVKPSASLTKISNDGEELIAYLIHLIYNAMMKIKIPELIHWLQIEVNIKALKFVLNV
jgi:hypothetical protein